MVPAGLLRHQRLIQQCGVIPLMYQNGEMVIIITREHVHGPGQQPLSLEKKA
jgi:hypothetical protein